MTSNNYKIFSGRLGRQNTVLALVYLLPMIAVSLLFALLASTMQHSIVSIIVYGIYIFSVVIILLLALSVFIRRLHDSSRSGLYLLIYFIPFGGLYLLYLYFFVKSDINKNKYGTCLLGHNYLAVLGFK